MSKTQRAVQTVLSTGEAAEALSSPEEAVSPAMVAKLARNRKLPGAIKDQAGRWQIPIEALESHKSTTVTDSAISVAGKNGPPLSREAPSRGVAESVTEAYRSPQHRSGLGRWLRRIGVLVTGSVTAIGCGITGAAALAFCISSVGLLTRPISSPLWLRLWLVLLLPSFFVVRWQLVSVLRARRSAESQFVSDISRYWSITNEKTQRGRLAIVAVVIGLAVDLAVVLNWVFGNSTEAIATILSGAILLLVLLPVFAQPGRESRWGLIALPPPQLLYRVVNLASLAGAILVFMVVSARVLAPFFEYGFDPAATATAALIFLFGAIGAGSRSNDPTESWFWSIGLPLFTASTHLVFAFGLAVWILPVYYALELQNEIDSSNLPRATVMARRSVLLNQFRADDLLRVARASEDRGLLSSAAEMYLALADADPSRRWAYIEAARIAFEEGKLQAAINLADIAVKKNDDREADMFAYLIQGKAYLQQGDLRLARTALEETVRLERNPSGLLDWVSWRRFAEPYYYLGIVQDRLGEPSDYCTWKFVEEFAHEAFPREVAWKEEAMHRLRVLEPPNDPCLP